MSESTPVSCEPVTIPLPDGDLPATMWRPASGTGPGIVLVQEIFGVSDYIRSRAADLAGLGYVVVAPEFYHRLLDREIDETSPAFLDQALAVMSRFDWDAGVADGVAALEWLRARPETGDVGLVGFCFGGGLAFAITAAAADDGVEVSALVSYYGSALPELTGLAERVQVPSLHHFGESDSYLPMEQVERVRAALEGANPATDVRTYPDADHAFDNPHPMFHQPDASRLAWAATETWLAEHLPTAG